MREKLKNVYLNRYRTRGTGGIPAMAKSIGISQDTLRKYLHGNVKNLNIRTKPLVEEYLGNQSDEDKMKSYFG